MQLSEGTLLKEDIKYNYSMEHGRSNKADLT